MRILFVLCLLFYSSSIFSAFPNELPANASPQTQWVFSRANSCLHANNITRIAANGECLTLQTYFAKSIPSPRPTLLVFIHGDGIPGGGPSDYLKYQATKFISPHTVPVILIRPGYYDSYGHYSTGESYAFSNHGYPNDSYRRHTVTTIADAVKQLKQFYQPRCTILIGHSGGAAMSGIILGKYPKLANSAVLASVVGNVHAWAHKHQYGTYPHSLSPDHFVKKIPKNTSVYIVSGTNDSNTYPSMSHNYYEQLRKAGVNAHWVSVQGGTHNSVVLTKAQSFDTAIKEAMQHCQSN